METVKRLQYCQQTVTGEFHCDGRTVHKQLYNSVPMEKIIFYKTAVFWNKTSRLYIMSDEFFIFVFFFRSMGEGKACDGRTQKKVNFPTKQRKFKIPLNPLFITE